MRPPFPFALHSSLMMGDSLVILLLLGLAFMIWMLLDCLHDEPGEGGQKLLWCLVILFAPFGSILYFLVRKLSRKSRT